MAQNGWIVKTTTDQGDAARSAEWARTTYAAMNVYVNTYKRTIRAGGFAIDVYVVTAKRKDAVKAAKAERAAAKAARIARRTPPTEGEIGSFTAASLDPSARPDHNRDEDCDVDPATDLCRACGVHHGDPCVECGGRGFHKPGCSESDETIAAAAAVRQ